MKRKTHRSLPHSIRWNLFLWFVLFCAVVMALLFAGTFFMNDIYQAVKITQMERAGDTVVSHLGKTDWESYVTSLAKKDELCAVVYVMYGDSDGMELLSEDYGGLCVIHHIEKASRFDMYRMARLQGDTSMQRYRFDQSRGVYVSITDRQDNIKDQESLVYARAVQAEDGQQYFVLLNAQITPVDAAVSTVRVLSAGIGAVLLLLSFLLAFILSRRIARPIVRIRDGASRLSRREYDLQLQERAYREVAELSLALNHAGSELSRVDDLCRELISNVSHDLRTPLTMIRGYAEVMRDLPGENTPENVQVIIDETNRLTSLVNDVLDLSRFQSGAQALQRLPFNVTESVRQGLLSYQKLSESQGYQIDFHYTKDVTVCSDQSRFMQAFFNLVNNALTYTDQASKRISVTQTVQNDRVRLSVTDYGEGIEKDELPLIFDRYHRTASSHRRPASGTGLGLAIVRAVMDELGGAYGVSSQIGVGSTFYIELPL